jgi:hypothetical protein
MRSDLIQRLRACHRGEFGQPEDPINPDGPEAADALEAQDAKLKAAVAEIEAIDLSAHADWQPSHKVKEAALAILHRHFGEDAAPPTVTDEDVERAAEAMRREDPIPLQMFTDDELRDLARAALESRRR